MLPPIAIPAAAEPVLDVLLDDLADEAGPASAMYRAIERMFGESGATTMTPPAATDHAAIAVLERLAIGCEDMARDTGDPDAPATPEDCRLAGSIVRGVLASVVVSP